MIKLLILINLMSIDAYGIDFDKRHYQVISDIIQAADSVKAPRALILGLCWSESSFRTNLPHKLDGHTPSYGICQVKLETALFLDQYFKNKHKATKARLLIPKVNATYAAQYIKFQLKRYNGDWKRAIDAYNKGHAVSRQSQYVKRVTKHMSIATRHLASLQ